MAQKRPKRAHLPSTTRGLRSVPGAVTIDDPSWMTTRSPTNTTSGCHTAHGGTMTEPGPNAPNSLASGGRSGRDRLTRALGPWPDSSEGCDADPAVEERAEQGSAPTDPLERHRAQADEVLAGGDPAAIKQLYVELGQDLEAALATRLDDVPVLSFPETFP